MHIASKVTIGAMFLAVACAPADKALAPPAAPDFKGKPQDVACKTKDLKAVQKGKITANDCLFEGTQRENLYRADQQALGLPDFSGSHMLVFEQDAEFDGIYGISDWDDTPFGDPVFGYQTFVANDASRSFAVIGSDPEYKLFVSGADETQLGKYTLTTSVATSANSCETGRRTVLQGNVAFSSAITDATSCEGVVEVGPYVGQPLNYQFWYAKLTTGQNVTVRADGIDGDDPSVTLAVIVFGSPFAQLDFSSGAGDTDREISFTVPFDAYYYVEVSSSPGVSSPYHLTFTSE
ncbi:MAG: hypothetical protein U9Q74_10735 [Gemmatimonadota bacterium]|nr:hypothetical protein [Gemmatimonadota bacterium]